MYSLTDKVVVITGGANGIGAAIAAEALKDAAKHVRLLDIDEKCGQQIAYELNEKYGSNKAKFVTCNVTNDDDFFGALEDTKAEHDYIDVVFNNAGVTNESNYAEIRKQVQINLTAVINGTYKAIELMDKTKGGRGGAVMNTASIAGMYPICPALPVYSATKAAVVQFTRSIGADPIHANTGVRVLALCIGVTYTNILENLYTFEDKSAEQVKSTFAPFMATMQNPEAAARGSIDAYKNGKSATVWLIHKSKPAINIFEDKDTWGVEVAQLLGED